MNQLQGLALTFNIYLGSYGAKSVDSSGAYDRNTISLGKCKAEPPSTLAFAVEW